MLCMCVCVYFFLCCVVEFYARIRSAMLNNVIKKLFELIEHISMIVVCHPLIYSLCSIFEVFYKIKTSR